MNVRISFFTVFLLLSIVVGSLFYYQSCIRKKEKEPQIDTTLVIERIEKVMKLVSIEGHYSELLKYDNSTFDFPGFRKKALVQVTGKVLVGYDLEKYQMDYDEENKVLTIDQFPAPEIIAIETNSKYFDIEQGIFNSFSKEELTNIDKKSKEVIRQKALQDQLIQSAEEQKNDLLQIVLEPLILSGWTVKINGQDFKYIPITHTKD